MMRIASTMTLALLAACACGRAGGGTGTGGSGSGGGSAADCEAVRAHVRELYTAVPRPADTAPAAIETFVTDNTAMVLAECAREPGRVAPCAGRAATVEALEAKCLAPLDDEGSEGDVFRSQ